jgi:hypothetical protein
MSVLKVAVASVIALSLTLGLALPALADPGGNPSWTEDFQGRIVKGTVTYVDEADQEYFEVMSGDDELTIAVDEDTGYFKLGAPGRLVALAQRFRLRLQEESGAQGERGMGLQNRVKAAVRNQARLRNQNQVAQTESVPVESQMAMRRPFGAGAEFSDIEVGDRVMVWMSEDDNLAKWVLILKQASYARVGGTITDIDSSTIEITTEDGEEVSLDYDESTVFVLEGFTSVEEGQYAWAVYDSQSMLAQRVVISLE